MTPAEFKARRESLGLSTAWLARRWDVSLMSVQRWERNRPMPTLVERDFDAIVRYAYAAVADGVDRGDPVLTVPRTDAESPDGYPSAYHRAVALRIADRTGARIEFAGES